MDNFRPGYFTPDLMFYRDTKAESILKEELQEFYGVDCSHVAARIYNTYGVKQTIRISAGNKSAALIIDGLVNESVPDKLEELLDKADNATDFSVLSDPELLSITEFVYKTMH